MILVYKNRITNTDQNIIIENLVPGEISLLLEKEDDYYSFISFTSDKTPEEVTAAIIREMKYKTAIFDLAELEG